MKYGGLCAYCGKPLEDTFHIDHRIPLYRGWEDKPKDDSDDNKEPSCPRCNRWKKVFTVDEFRKEIEAQKERLMKIPQFRLALDYGLIQFTNNQVTFHFEKESK